MFNLSFLVWSLLMFDRRRNAFGGGGSIRPPHAAVNVWTRGDAPGSVENEAGAAGGHGICCPSAGAHGTRQVGDFSRVFTRRRVNLRFASGQGGAAGSP